MLPDGPPAVLGFGTGPGRLAVDDDGSAVVAYPDETGDIAVDHRAGPGAGGPGEPAVGPVTATLPSDAPFRRHFAARLALHDGVRSCSTSSSAAAAPSCG